MKAVVAMSGGVDSSVAAALMRREGHDVIGVTLKLWQGANGEAPTAGCCTVSDAEDARRVAAQLDIPYYVLDYTDDFRDSVVDPFVDAYLNGRTPNPCVECNRSVKFSRLLSHADELGADVLVTGHYSRTEGSPGDLRLLRGVDREKDQSYVLYMLGQYELERSHFPVGNLTKAETRRIASDLGLRTAHKKDSQDICFVGDRDYRDFLAEQVPVAIRPGKVRGVDGAVLGDHDGIARFTIGQRRKLGVQIGEPRYVVDIQPATATVVVGRRSELRADGFSVQDLTWVAGSVPDADDMTVKVRYHGRDEPVAAFESTADRAHVVFARGVEAVAPGQAAVFYRGEAMLGGGTIASAA